MREFSFVNLLQSECRYRNYPVSSGRRPGSRQRECAMRKMPGPRPTPGRRITLVGVAIYSGHYWANAGVQTCVARASRREAWIPAFAGMTYFYDDLFLSSAVAEQSRCSPRDMQEMLRAEKSPAQHRPSLECLV
jgi:hypothetical protein